LAPGGIGTVFGQQRSAAHCLGVRGVATDEAFADDRAIDILSLPDLPSLVAKILEAGQHGLGRQGRGHALGIG
jgi:hypothetical protein